MDQPKMERLLRLMQLLAGKTSHTIDGLARLLNTTPRTVYRYIDTFKEAGFVVLKLPGNVYKIGQMPPNAPTLDNVIYFSEEEACIVNRLIDNLDSTNNLKIGLKRKLASIYDMTGIAEYTDGHNNSAKISTLADAIKNKRKVRLLKYESANSASIKDRCVEPFDFSANFIDVWAYDLNDLRNKVFKISRIGEVEPIEEYWEFESSHRRHGTDVFRMSGRFRKRVKLQLGLRSKNLLIEEYPLAANDISRQGAHWILDTDIYDYAGICRFYLGLADEIKILDSPEFEAYVQAYAQKHIVR